MIWIWYPEVGQVQNSLFWLDGLLRSRLAWVDQAAEDNEPAKSHCSSHIALNTPLFANIAHIALNTPQKWRKAPASCWWAASLWSFGAKSQNHFRNHRLLDFLSHIVELGEGEKPSLRGEPNSLDGCYSLKIIFFQKRYSIRIDKRKKEKWLGGWPLSEISHKWDYCCKSWPPGGKIAAKFDARHY